MPFMIKVELLKSGEFGPRDVSPAGGKTVQIQVGTKGKVPFLNATEYVRSKVKAWSARGEDKDLVDVHTALKDYEHEMNPERISADGDLEQMIETEESDRELSAAMTEHVKGIKTIYGRIVAAHQSQKK